MHAKLTQATIAKLKGPTDGQPVKYHWDTSTPGLAVQVSRTGHRSFVAKHAKDQKTIGPVNTMALDQARAEAGELLAAWRKAAVARRQADRERRGDLKAEFQHADRQTIADMMAKERELALTAEREERRKQRERDLTFGQVLDAYIAERTVPDCEEPLRPGTVAFYRRIACLHLSDWLDLPLRAITGTMFKERYNAIAAKVKIGGWSRPHQTGAGSAQITKAIVSLVWNHGIAMEIDGLGSNPTKTINKAVRKKMMERKRNVPLKKLGEFWRALDRLPTWQAGPLADYSPGDCLRFLVLTGMRRRNATQLRWDEIDWEAKMIRIPAGKMKSRRDFNLPMNQLVEGLLRERRSKWQGEAAIYPAECPWVFPADNRTSHIRDLRRPLRDASKLAGLADAISPHDLRRTFADCCTEANLHDERTGLLMDHATFGGADKKTRTTRKYRKQVEGVMRRSADVVGHYMAQAFGLVPPDGKVVAIRPTTEPQADTAMPAVVPATEQVTATA